MLYWKDFLLGLVFLIPGVLIKGCIIIHQRIEKNFMHMLGIRLHGLKYLQVWEFKISELKKGGKVGVISL